jgi:hypothetical protein
MYYDTTAAGGSQKKMDGKTGIPGLRRSSVPAIRELPAK